MLFDNDKSGKCRPTASPRPTHAVLTRCSVLADAIAYEEFLEGLTGGAAFSTERQAVVKEAFAKFDYNDTLTCPLAMGRVAVRATMRSKSRSARSFTTQPAPRITRAPTPNKVMNHKLGALSEAMAVLHQHGINKSHVPIGRSARANRK